MMRKNYAWRENEKKTAELKEFLYIVFHDIHAPLRAVVEFSRLLQNDYAKTLDDEGKLYLSLVHENGHKLQNIVLALQKYTQLSDANLNEKVNLNNVLKSTETNLKELMTSRNAQIESDKLPTLKGSQNLLEILWTSLIENAVIYASPERAPLIRVSAAKVTQGWQFNVEDNGSGIQADFIESAFKPFKRLVSQKDIPGLGMGLTLAKKIVELHGGTISIMPRVNCGTIVSFTLLNSSP